MPYPCECFVPLNPLILWVKHSEEWGSTACDFSSSGFFLCKQDYKFKLTCASPPRTIILLLYSELCCWWAPHLVFHFHCLSRVFCQLFILPKSLAFLNYYYYYICLLGLIRLQVLNIFVFFFCCYYMFSRGKEVQWWLSQSYLCYTVFLKSWAQNEHLSLVFNRWTLKKQIQAYDETMDIWNFPE